MIMKLLLLLLLTTTAAWGTPTQREIDCLELYDVLQEAVEEGYIKEQEALSIHYSCIAYNDK